MTLNLKEIAVDAALLPASYALIGLYGGTSEFPLTTFFVLRDWWELFLANPEFKLCPLTTNPASGALDAIPDSPSSTANSFARSADTT